MTIKRYWVVAIIGLFILFLLGGCGVSSSTSTDDADNPGSVEKTQSKTLIMHVSALIGNTRVAGILSPGKEATIGAVNLEDENVKVILDISGGTVTITPSNVSIEDQSITFTVPGSAVDGTLSILTGDTSTSKVAYRIFTEDSHSIATIEPASAKSGDSVIITGDNLPNIPLELVFEGQDSSLNLSVTPYEDQFSFTVPSALRSGNIYLQLAQDRTNKLYLAVKRDIDVQVVFPRDLALSASDISFALAGLEYVLDKNFAANIPVDNESPQYIHAVLDQHDGNFPLLYSAVVLPENMETVIVDAKSTAIAWVFLGMGATAVEDNSGLRPLYDAIASNAKVLEFADYVETLQEQDFTKWANLDDPVLKQKYQDALKDCIYNDPGNKAAQKPARAAKSNPLVNITQYPENNNIYFEHKSKDGSVSLINDTKLYMSVEVRSRKGNEVVNNYEHINSLLQTNANSLVGPKGWGLLGIASEKKLDLNGVDSNIEVVIGAYNGETDKEDIESILLARIFIDGIATPALNMAISALLDNSISSDNSFSDVIGAMNDIYGANFLNMLFTQTRDKNADWNLIADTLLIRPLKKGFDSCFQVPIGTACENTMKGLSKLNGLTGADDIVATLMQLVVETAEKRIIKKTAVLVPVVGWIVEASFFVYDNIGYVSDTATIAESIYDMGVNPKEINADVEFALEVSEIKPACLDVSPAASPMTLEIIGDGFTAEDGAHPYVEMGIEENQAVANDIFVNVDGTQMLAYFDASGLIDEGSREDNIFVGYDGSFWIMSNQTVKIIDETDRVVYFDSIEPNRARAGETVTLKGCGWLPLSDINVYFKSDNGYVKAETLATTIDTIEAIVPDNAKSGTVYVSAGNKETRKLFFEIDPFSLTGADTDVLLEGSGVILEGKELADVTKVYFTDHTGSMKEGAITYTTIDSIRVATPAGLKHGEIRIYAERENGNVSNELTLPMVPKWVQADPPGQAFEESIQVALTQEEDLDIFYRIDDGEEQSYAGPVTLYANDAKYEYFTLYAYGRVVVEGTPYDSRINEYEYTPCADNEILEGGVCVADTNPPDGLDGCPVAYDSSLDEDSDYDYKVGLLDKNGDGEFEDFFECNYWETGQLRIETPYVNGLLNGTARFYNETGQLGSETSYIDGKKNGTQKIYYYSGLLKEETPYVDDVIEGTTRYYFDNGQLWRALTYVSGLAHGEQRWYTRSGEPNGCQLYEHGEYVSACT